MLMMENAEEVQQALERFTKLKQTLIPTELEDYLCFVAKSGDTIFRWAVIKALFREKLIAVIKQFHEQTAIDDLPHYPNVDPFNYETMKTALLERLDSFSAAPFTVQRICELLTDPRKQYSRIDKFMRAIEKNILVVSTTEPGRPKSLADSSDYSDSLDSMVNGSSNVTVGALGDIDVDIELENGTATIAGTEAGALPTTAALPSINTLNSAILAASNGSQTPAATTANDLLGTHHDPLNDDDVDDEDDDDDEDVVHNHLTTDPAEEALETPSGAAPTGAATVVPVDTAAVPIVPGDEEEEVKKNLAKKRADEGEEEVDNAKRAKLEDDDKAKETIPESSAEEVKKEEDVIKPTGEEEAVAGGSSETAAPVEITKAAETCEQNEVTEAKDLQADEPTVTQKQEVEENKGEASTLLDTDKQMEEAVKVEEATEDVDESEKKVDEIASEPHEAVTSDQVVLPPAEPIADVVVEAEKESLSPEEAMETVVSDPITASEMDVDSSEGTTAAVPALLSEESVSMDEPMEDQ